MKTGTRKEREWHGTVLWVRRNEKREQRKEGEVGKKKEGEKEDCTAVNEGTD